MYDFVAIGQHSRRNSCDKQVDIENLTKKPCQVHYCVALGVLQGF